MSQIEKNQRRERQVRKKKEIPIEIESLFIELNMLFLCVRLVKEIYAVMLLNRFLLFFLFCSFHSLNIKFSISLSMNSSTISDVVVCPYAKFISPKTRFCVCCLILERTSNRHFVAWQLRMSIVYNVYTFILKCYVF
jgi:hypothetical protein